MRTLLEQVVDHGAPAQSARARELIEALRERPEEQDLQVAARALVDAFLHDPYLTRFGGQED